MIVNNTEGCFYRPNKFNIGGAIASVLGHAIIIALAIGLIVDSTNTNKGMLPPAINLQLGLYQVEQAQPEKVDGAKQVLSIPKPQQVEETVHDTQLDKLPVVEHGTFERKVKKKEKTPVHKANVEIKTPDAPTPTNQFAESTSAPRAGDATQSRADFASSASQAQSGRVGWESDVHNHLAKHKRYPRAAARFKASGISHVRVILNHQGEVLLAELVTSSGTRILDKEALATIKRATPFPTPPVNILHNDKIEMITPISFYL